MMRFKKLMLVACFLPFVPLANVGCQSCESGRNREFTEINERYTRDRYRTIDCDPTTGAVTKTDIIKVTVQPLPRPVIEAPTQGGQPFIPLR